MLLHEGYCPIVPFRFLFRFALNRIRKGRVATTVLNTVKHYFKNALQKDLLQIITGGPPLTRKSLTRFPLP